MKSSKPVPMSTRQWCCTRWVAWQCTALDRNASVTSTDRADSWLVAYEPGHSVRYLIDSPHVTGYVQLMAHGGRGTRSVVVRGTLQSKARLARLASIPFAPAVESAIAREARRTLARAATVLGAEKNRDISRELN